MDTVIVMQGYVDDSGGNVELKTENPNHEHNYCIIKQEISKPEMIKTFAKCEKCRKSRTKVHVPTSFVPTSKDDGKTCDFCGDVMVKPFLESPPLKKKSKAKEFVKCSTCEIVLQKESLAKHIKDMHEKTNKVSCKICGKILAGSFSLKEHISAVHEKILKHECSFCHKAFSHFSNMKRHIKLIHESSVITNKYVNCPMCQKLVQEKSLKKHIKALHENCRDFVCSYCQQSFAQSFTLKEHIAAKHTKIYKHKCAECHRQFAHKTNYIRHMKTMHPINA